MFKMGCSMARKILGPGAASSGNEQAAGGAHLAGGGDKSSSSSKRENNNNNNNGNNNSNNSKPAGGSVKCSADELGDFSKLEDDPRLPLNVRQIFKITKSWKAIARTMSKTGTAMFLNLFEQNQDLFYLFDRFQHLKGKELHDSMELREHAATVMATLDQSINSLSDYDNFVSYLHSIGQMHRKVPGFKREYFWKIEQPFMKAVKQTLDERCNETIEQIYMIAIKLIIETIAEGYGQDGDDDDAAGQSGGNGAAGQSGGARGRDGGGSGAGGGNGGGNGDKQQDGKRPGSNENSAGGDGGGKFAGGQQRGTPTTTAIMSPVDDGNQSCGDVFISESSELISDDDDEHHHQQQMSEKCAPNDPKQRQRLQLESNLIEATCELMRETGSFLADEHCGAADDATRNGGSWRGLVASLNASLMGGGELDAGERLHCANKDQDDDDDDVGEAKTSCGDGGRVPSSARVNKGPRRDCGGARGGGMERVSQLCKATAAAAAAIELVADDDNADQDNSTPATRLRRAMRGPRASPARRRVDSRPAARVGRAEATQRLAEVGGELSPSSSSPSSFCPATRRRLSSTPSGRNDNNAPPLPLRPAPSECPLAMGASQVARKRARLLDHMHSTAPDNQAAEIPRDQRDLIELASRVASTTTTTTTTTTTRTNRFASGEWAANSAARASNQNGAQTGNSNSIPATTAITGESAAAGGGGGGGVGRQSWNNNHLEITTLDRDGGDVAAAAAAAAARLEAPPRRGQDACQCKQDNDIGGQQGPPQSQLRDDKQPPVVAAAAAAARAANDSGEHELEQREQTGARLRKRHEQVVSKLLATTTTTTTTPAATTASRSSRASVSPASSGELADLIKVLLLINRLALTLASPARSAASGLRDDLTSCRYRASGLSAAC